MFEFVFDWPPAVCGRNDCGCGWADGNNGNDKEPFPLFVEPVMPFDVAAFDGPPPPVATSAIVAATVVGAAAALP